MKHLGDITKINGADVPPVNVIIGGSPCQDLSVAGRREGLKGERSGLFMEQIRIIKEMRSESERNGATDVRPRYMVWENVPGAFSSNKGQDFKAVLEETIGVVEKENKSDIPIPDGGWHYSGCIVGDGFSVAWRVFDAQFWGVPQRRRRVALIADFGGFTAPEILFERKGVFGDITQSGTPWKDFAMLITKQNIRTDTSNSSAKLNNIDLICATMSTYMNINESGDTAFSILSRDYKSPQYVCAEFKANMSSKAYGIGYKEQLSPTLSANQHDASIVSQNFLRYLTPLEYERLQGFPDGWTDIGDYIDSKGKKRKTSDSARYKALGNSIALPSWVWVLERLSLYCTNRTMASLFDGIGGFPLIWETLNGKGTCLWASEIEEFPIAVTNYHFNKGE